MRCGILVEREKESERKERNMYQIKHTVDVHKDFFRISRIQCKCWSFFSKIVAFLGRNDMCSTFAHSKFRFLEKFQF